MILYHLVLIHFRKQLQYICSVLPVASWIVAAIIELLK